jgi:hypothetical protein
MKLRAGLVVGIFFVALASCKTPVDIAGDFVGAASESATLAGGVQPRSWSRSPADERVTVTRGLGRDLHIKFGSCDLPSRANPDGLSATIVYGKCWVSGFPGPVPVEGTFAVDAPGNTLTAQISGSMTAAAGTVSYSYAFSGARSAP